MILGIGIDVIEPERIARAIARPRFLERMYTERERARIASAGALRAERAAGIFAGKEAAVKALGTGFAGIGFCDVEIIADDRGRPELVLHGAAKARADEMGVRAAHISISHIKSVAAAQVILEG